jgi:hypothetical protein
MTAMAAYYIKLGTGGKWAEDSIKHGIARISTPSQVSVLLQVFSQLPNDARITRASRTSTGAMAAPATPPGLTACADQARRRRGACAPGFSLTSRYGWPRRRSTTSPADPCKTRLLC